MKSADEIKKGLVCMAAGLWPDKVCAGCPYWKKVGVYNECIRNEFVPTDALALIQQLEAQVPRWISVEERLPESIVDSRECDMSNAVLLYTPVDGYVHIGWYMRKDYRGRDLWHTLSAMRSHQTMTKKVTHWMPLPEPPKEDNHV